MFNPIDTPTPVSPAPALAVALTVASLVFCALSATSPAPAFTVAPTGITACVVASE